VVPAADNEQDRRGSWFAAGEKRRYVDGGQWSIGGEGESSSEVEEDETAATTIDKIFRITN
jgi:hypothetical protein